VCGRSVEPGKGSDDSEQDTRSKEPPVADAGPDQTTRVGSYIILDATKSKPGGAEKIVYYKWSQDKNNPARVRSLLSGSADSLHYIGFTKEGVYKFTLIVNNGIQDSEPDEVIVTVNPRDNIIFEDPSLEIHIRFALKKPDGELTENDLLSITKLNYALIIVDDVASLKGIEHCKNLEFLGMQLQKISDISPLSGLKKLTHIDLDQNLRIRDLNPLSGLTELRHLNLEKNKIVGITPLANLTELIYLNIKGNPVRDISVVSNMKKMQQFWMCDSQTNDISGVAGLNDLSLLWVSSCRVKDITPIKNLTKLRTIYFTDNQIVDISPLKRLTDLEYIDLDKNQIVDVSPLEKLVKIRRLNLWYNRITDILPLVKNRGLGRGDFLGLIGNPLNEKSVNEYIPELRKRGVYVSW